MLIITRMKVGENKKTNNSKKNVKKVNVVDKLKKMDRKYILIMSSLLLIILLTILIIIPKIYLNQTMVVVDGMEYKRSDYMIYLYSAKVDRFGEKNTKLPKATLNGIVDTETNITLAQLLKEEALNNIKIDAAIRNIAKKNNVSLDDTDYSKLNEEKIRYISILGDKSDFNKMLKENNTSEKSYDRMMETQYLYDKLLTNLYAKGKDKDLTNKEMESAKLSYINDYYKIKQIVLFTVNESSGEKISTSEINEKEKLIEKILKEYKDGKNFDYLIKKYSEDVIDSDATLDIYFRKGTMIEDVEKTVQLLENGEVSDVVTSNLGFHIILREKLDYEALDEYYEYKRSEKLLTDISNIIKELPIILEDSYSKFKVER